MLRTLNTLILLSVIAVSGCAAPAPPEPVVAATLDNASYPGVYDEPVTLVEGNFEGAPAEPGAATRPTLTRVSELDVFADLDGDGVADAATLLIENSGGSGSFVYLAAVLAREQGATQANTVPLGDRVQIVSMTLAGATIVIDSIIAAEGDALTSPTLKIRARYRWDGDALVQDERKETGRLSTADLVGPIWLLLEHDQDRRVAGGVSITAIFNSGRLGGSSGCNDYFAPYRSTAAGELQLGALGGTRKACAGPAMIEENEFLKRVGHVVGYRFWFGRLQLDFDLGGQIGSLLFEPHDASEAQ